jgi:hypothetical protein
MKFYKIARKYGSKAAAGAGALVLASSAMAQTADPSVIEQIIASVGITGIAASVVVLMIGVVGIAMAFKGGSLGKRAVKMV